MTRLRFWSGLVVGALVALPAMAQTDTGAHGGHPAVAPPALASFAREAAAGGMAEVELGRLAVQKASNPAVKEFGQHMVDDHAKANAELQSIAAQAGVELPSAMDAKQKKIYDKLSSLSGSAFDRAYMDDMVKDHKEDIAAFEKASRAPGDSPFKAFATDKLPTLRQHLQMAQVTQTSLGKPAGSPSGKR